MILDAIIQSEDLKFVPKLAKEAENLGFNTLWFNEIRHDPFIPIALATLTTSNIKLGTSVALAFTRSPMVIAYSSWDLQKLSNGRFILGLGSQVKGHIKRRFSVEWESPVTKMKEVILSLKEIWKSWQDGTKLTFKGKYYSFDLMTPFFNPGPIPNPRIPIFLGAVNKLMIRLAGELCDGILIHPLHTIKYIKEVVLPNIEKGALRANRNPLEVQKMATVFIATGNDKNDIKKAIKDIKNHIAFYASTRTYKIVLNTHGLDEVSDKLHKLSLEGKWEKMSEQIPEEFVNEVAVIGNYEEIPEMIKQRYDRLVSKITLYKPFNVNEEWWKKFIKAWNKSFNRF